MLWATIADGKTAASDNFKTTPGRGNGERGNGSENFSALLSTFLTILDNKAYSKTL